MEKLGKYTVLANVVHRLEKQLPARIALGLVAIIFAIGGCLLGKRSDSVHATQTSRAGDATATYGAEQFHAQQTAVINATETSAAGEFYSQLTAIAPRSTPSPRP